MFDWIKHIAFRWQDIVDIVLNSYILFRLYILFRGTNTQLVFLGIGALWFFYRLSVYLGLVLTSWVIQGITAVAALIIVVVFRNELRNVFQAKTLRAIFWGLPHRKVETPIEIVSGAVFDLARRYIGALLVIPGKENLGEILRSGIEWKGVVSPEMIFTIFWKDNPVHDGAAIVEGNTISRVGVLLPLSNRQDVPSYYGTRHRAALGLSEFTDALVIAVSEERGTISVFHNGVYTNTGSQDHLIRLLTDHLGQGPRPLRFFKRDGFRTAVAVVISFLVVTTAWYSLTRGRDTLITMECPIEFLNRGPGMEIAETTENNVRLHLSGSGALIKSIRPDQVRVYLDLGQAVVGVNTLPIRQKNVSIPPGIVLSSVTPPSIDVVLDVNSSKELPIQVDWAGKLPDHLIITHARPTPDKIVVNGRSLRLRNVNTVYTEKVMVDHIDKSGRIITRLDLGGLPVRLDAGVPVKIIIDFDVLPREKTPLDR